MKTRRLIYFLMVVLVINLLYIAKIVPVEATTVVIDTVNINHQLRLVTIGGTISSGEGRQVTLKVLKPNSQDTDYFKQTISSLGGKFEFKYILGENAVENADYQVIISGRDINFDSQAKSTFKYFGPQTINLALQSVNSANVNNMLSILEQFNHVLLLPLELDSDINKIRNVQHVYSDLMGNNFTSLDTLRVVFANSVQQQIGLDSLYAANLSDIENILKNEYKNIFELDLSNEGNYGSLSGNGKESVLEAVYNKNFYRVPDVKLAFNSKVAIQSLNEATRATISSVIQKNNYILDLPLSGDYKNFDDFDKSDVYKKIIEKIPFSSISQIKTAFVNAAEEVRLKKSEESKQDNKNSNGSSTSIKMTPVINNIPQNSVSFNDIETVQWAKESINFLAQKGIVKGIGNSMFKPNESVTREQFVKMLMEAFNLVDEEAVVTFNDVDQDAWYYRFVASATKLNVIKGIEESVFGIGSEITRQDMAVMAYRVLALVNLNLTQSGQLVDFIDKEEISSYALEAINAMNQAGIIKGVGEGRFEPKATLTRAMAAKVVYELMKLKQ